MHEGTNSPARKTAMMVAFEGGLGLLTLFVIAALDWWRILKVSALCPNLVQCCYVVIAAVASALPLVGAAILLERFRCASILRLRHRVYQMVVPLFMDLSITQLALVSLAAGFGEELFFRGLLQSGTADLFSSPIGSWIGVILASLLFGAAHWITRTYALLATLVGFYLGVIFLISGNLLIPILSHSFYDFVILVYLVKKKKSGSS